MHMLFISHHSSGKDIDLELLGCVHVACRVVASDHEDTVVFFVNCDTHAQLLRSLPHYLREVT